MIGRGLRAMPAAAWALLPGVLTLIWWFAHEPASVGPQAELDEVQARIDGLAEYRERADELPALKEELTIRIELIRRLKAILKPVAPSVDEFFRVLPRDLAIERLVVTKPAWDLRLDVTETNSTALHGLADELRSVSLVESAGVIERREGALTLYVQLSLARETWP